MTRSSQDLTGPSSLRLSTFAHALTQVSWTRSSASGRLRVRRYAARKRASRCGSTRLLKRSFPGGCIGLLQWFSLTDTNDGQETHAGAGEKPRAAARSSATREGPATAAMWTYSIAGQRGEKQSFRTAVHFHLEAQLQERKRGSPGTRSFPDLLLAEHALVHDQTHLLQRLESRQQRAVQNDCGACPHAGVVGYRRFQHLLRVRRPAAGTLAAHEVQGEGLPDDVHDTASLYCFALQSLPLFGHRERESTSIRVTEFATILWQPTQHPHEPELLACFPEGLDARKFLR